MRVSYDTELGGSSTSISTRFRQQTLKNSIYCSGTGLHGGAKVSMSLHPAAPDTGIVFRRSDIDGDDAVIPARHDLVSDTRLCTTLSNDAGVSVSTVEHLMAALAGCGLDNVIIEINGPELPIMDGSAEPFVFLIDCAGVVAQATPRRAIRVCKTVSVEDGDSVARIEPWMGSSINIELDFETAVIGRQSIFVDMLADSFREKLSRARTFGFLHEVEALQAAGLARGGSMENAVVISGDTVLNEGGLRFDDECARHKALDCVGDLYLAGATIIGHFHGVRPGHAINNKLLRKLMADDSAWELVEMDEIENEIAEVNARGELVRA
ncbi:MAG: UDP-3-O-acyl-N-acetylglucosamine deacetylase [Proteobacteria bacterium]|nr:UDP-3-O-acyl-N-acetylglucosamine deacetylase [Pseudomonadota bacterium]